MRLIFNIDSNEFEKMVKTDKFSKFKKINLNIVMDKKNDYLYRKALEEALKYLSNISEFYTYKRSESRYERDILIVNDAHNKVYFRSF